MSDDQKYRLKRASDLSPFINTNVEFLNGLWFRNLKDLIIFEVIVAIID